MVITGVRVGGVCVGGLGLSWGREEWEAWLGWGWAIGLGEN